MAKSTFDRRKQVLLIFLIALTLGVGGRWQASAERRAGLESKIGPPTAVPNSVQIDGELDTSFDADGVNTQFFGANTATRVDTAVGIGIQKNGANAGKIVIGGDTSGGGVADLAVTRFNTNGSLDDGSLNDSNPADVFGTAGKTTTDFGPGRNDINSTFSGSNYIAIDPTDDRIVIVGSSNTGASIPGCLSGPNNEWFVARYTADGLPDTAGFNAAGTVNGSRLISLPGRCDNITQGVIIQPDHKIVIVGLAFGVVAETFEMARLNEDGSLDTSFGSNGNLSASFSTVGLPYAVQRIGGVGPNAGKYIVVGDGFTSGQGSNFIVSRININGTLDMTFGPADTGTVQTFFTAGAVNETARSVVIQPDDKILVGGQGSNGSAFAMARYDSDGGLDPNFGTGGKILVDIFPAANGDVGTTVSLMTCGKIVMTGKGAAGQGIALVRFDNSGAIDNTFDSDGIVISSVGAANGPVNRTGILQADDKILVAGIYSGASTPVNDFFVARFFNTSNTPCSTASVSISGRIFSSNGVTGLRNAIVSLTDSSNGVRTTTTSSFGFYNFDNVIPGGTYTIRVSSRLFRFQPQSVTPSADLTGVDLVGLE